MEEIIDQFAAYRLLSLDHDPETRQPTVEVAHEAILREWDRLRQWLNDSRDDIRQERAVARAAEEWDAHERDASFLLRGTRLEQVEKWQQTTELIQTPLEQAFIAKSLQQREHEAAAKRARKEREAQLEQRSRNFLRGLVAVFAIATVIAGGLSILAFNLNNQSQRSAAEFRSIALTFGAQDALNNQQPDVALALAQEAINMENPPPAAQEMFFTASSSTWIQERFQISQAPVFSATYHPDGNRIITADADGRTVVWDIQTGEELQSIQRENALIYTAIIHPDGNLVANDGNDGIVQIWNLESNEVFELVYYLPEEPFFHGAADFSPDGSHLITHGSDAQIHVWETETFEHVRAFGFHDDNVMSLEFSADGSYVVGSSADGTVKVWDFGSGDLLQERLFNEDGQVWVWDAVGLSDNEHILVANAGIGVVLLWNWRSDEVIWTIQEDDTAQDIALSPDEQYFIVGFNDFVSDVQLRDVATGELIRVYQGHTLRVQDVEFSPDGTSLLSASSDGTVIEWAYNWEGTIRTVAVNSNNLVVWHPTEPLVATVGTASPFVNDTTIRLINTETGDIVQELVGHEASVRFIAFTEDGQSLISGSLGPSTILRWDLNSGEFTQVLPTESTSNDEMLLISDSQLFVPQANMDSNIQLWDFETGEILQTFEGHFDIVWALEFDAESQRLYSGSRDGGLYGWDIETGEIIVEFGGHENPIFDIDLNADGTHLVSASGDQTAIVWDATTGEQLITLNGHSAFVRNTEFSPDGRFILTAGADGRIILWDAETGDLVHIFVGGQNVFQTVGTFSPDGTQIVSSANDMLTFWDITNLPDDYEAWVTENRHIPDFTCDQRDLYQIEPLCEPES